ncbi:hypothetical protein [Pontibacter liquoris]|uniref:hypothetical protein n=1 Tax=Pontibacter liquoris TaxID=2905677 RepID=UPI001FA77B5E|nr:hypothetical protein [Pontibacter liquoris]
MTKRYKLFLPAVSVLLLVLLMQFMRTGSLQLSQVLVPVLFYLAGGLLAILFPAKQVQEL